MHAYYDGTLDPTVSNEFAGVASRFTASMMSHQGIDNPYYNPGFISDNGLCPAMQMMDSASQSPDVYHTSDVRSHHLDAVGFGTDLAAENIQLGRDLGVPGPASPMCPSISSHSLGYKQLVKSLGYYPIYTFSDISSDAILTGKMSSAYHNSIGEVDARTSSQIRLVIFASHLSGWCSRRRSHWRFFVW